MKYPTANPDWYRNTLREILDLADGGTITPVMSEPVPLSRAACAHEQLSRGRHAGKIVLTTT